MKILITGINGFVGGSIANYFCAKNHHIVGIGRQEGLAEFVNPKCDYLNIDISNPFREIEADIVIHSAAIASDTAKYETLFRCNVEGTKNVLNASRSANLIIHISTSSVYHFNEQALTEPLAGINMSKLSNYGKTKFIAEQLVLENKSIPHKFILRPRAIYGINDRLILPRLLKLVKRNRILFPKHITDKISLTHISNFISAIDLCIQNSKQTKIYNVSDDCVYDLGDVARNLILAVTRKELDVMMIPPFLWESIITLNQFIPFNKDLSRFGSNQLTKTSLLDISAIKNELGYLPKKTMNDSYCEIAKWVTEIGGWEKYLEQYKINVSHRK